MPASSVGAIDCLAPSAGQICATPRDDTRLMLACAPLPSAPSAISTRPRMLIVPDRGATQARATPPVVQAREQLAGSKLNALTYCASLLIHAPWSSVDEYWGNSFHVESEL